MVEYGQNYISLENTVMMPLKASYCDKIQQCSNGYYYHQGKNPSALILDSSPI